MGKKGKGLEVWNGLYGAEYEMVQKALDSKGLWPAQESIKPALEPLISMTQKNNI